MAIDYLRLIQVFSEATGARDLFSAPPAAQPIQTIGLGNGTQHAHFVFDLSLSKQILCESDNFPQDRFLDKLLADCQPEKVRWVKLFVEHSPEFLDGTNHTATRRSFRPNIDRFVSIVSAKPSQEITQLILHEADKFPLATLSIAKSIIRLRFTQILETILDTRISLDDDLLFGPEIFTPSIRIKASIYRLNDSTDRFIRRFVSPEIHGDISAILPILSLFYMASTPILASCVALLNGRVDSQQPHNESAISTFKMIPTNYVARESAVDISLGDTQIRKGDKLYVMLFDSTGCPFSDSRTMPFGHGKHLCPGAELSRLIIRQSKEAIDALPSETWAKLKVSTIQKGRGSAFLAFEN